MTKYLDWALENVNLALKMDPSHHAAIELLQNIETEKKMLQNIKYQVKEDVNKILGVIPRRQIYRTGKRDEINHIIPVSLVLAGFILKKYEGSSIIKHISPIGFILVHRLFHLFQEDFNRFRQRIGNLSPKNTGII